MESLPFLYILLSKHDNHLRIIVQYTETQSIRMMYNTVYSKTKELIEVCILACFYMPTGSVALNIRRKCATFLETSSRY